MLFKHTSVLHRFELAQPVLVIRNFTQHMASSLTVISTTV